MGQVLKGMLVDCAKILAVCVFDALFMYALYCLYIKIRGQPTPSTPLTASTQASSLPLYEAPLVPLHSQTNQSDKAASNGAAHRTQVVLTAWKQNEEKAAVSDVRLKHQLENDHKVAEKLAADLAEKSSELSEKEKRKLQLKNDHKVAEKLAAVFDKESKELVERQMTRYQDGKAWNFVQEVVDFHKSMEPIIMQATLQNSGVTTVAIDGLVWLTRRMMKKQEVFLSEAIPAMVDLGYHWTRPENMETIKTDGLLSKPERTKRQIHAKDNGSAHGDGIYTSDCHISHRSGYGPVCLLVARLKGTTSSLASDHLATFVKDTTVVLRSSDQCIPLLAFTDNVIADSYILQYQSKVQTIIDSYFNDGVSSILSRKRKFAQPAAVVPNPFSQSNSAAFITTMQPQGLTALCKTIRYIAPQALGGNAILGIKVIPVQAVVSTSDCAMCHNPLKGQCVGRIVKCGHEFHDECIRSAIEYSSQCALCKTNIMDPQGKMPDGQMQIQTKSNVVCGGFPENGTIEITYSLPSGCQKKYHP